MTTKTAFFADLVAHIHAHREDVTNVFQPLDNAALAWQPDPNEWSILICFDHLNQTYAYYQPKIAQALSAPVRVQSVADRYRPSFWGRVYMFFALNPRFSFPTPDALRPSDAPERTVLERYLIKQAELLDLLGRLDGVDLTRTRIPIERGITFNLGDCLKILVYHDSLHIGQAHGVLAQRSRDESDHMDEVRATGSSSTPRGREANSQGQ